MDLTLLPTFLRAVAALAFTLGLIALAAWLMRRYNGLNLSTPKAPPRLQILEKRNLSPTTTLYLVRHDDQEHLLASTSTQTTLLHTKSRGKKK